MPLRGLANLPRQGVQATQGLTHLTELLLDIFVATLHRSQGVFLLRCKVSPRILWTGSSQLTQVAIGPSKEVGRRRCRGLLNGLTAEEQLVEFIHVSFQDPDVLIAGLKFVLPDLRTSLVLGLFVECLQLWQSMP
eukprot:Skav201373  [mRNA]  locus=scaffold176:482970:485705:+ [translate_table: standard]